jgi:hypothetical protein
LQSVLAAGNQGLIHCCPAFGAVLPNTVQDLQLARIIHSRADMAGNWRDQAGQQLWLESKPATGANPLLHTGKGNRWHEKQIYQLYT